MMVKTHGIYEMLNHTISGIALEREVKYQVTCLTVEKMQLLVSVSNLIGERKRHMKIRAEPRTCCYAPCGLKEMWEGAHPPIISG